MKNQAIAEKLSKLITEIESLRDEILAETDTQVTAEAVTTPVSTTTEIPPMTATYAPNAPIVQPAPASEPVIPASPSWGNVPVQPVETASAEPTQTSAPQPAPFPNAPVSY